MTVNTKLRGAGMGAVLFLVAALLFVAGLSRLSLGVASAVAAEDTAPEPPESAVEIPDGGALFDALRAREARLLEQEKALADRSDALRAAEAQLRRQLDELQAAESRLAATLAQTESAAENDLSRLTTVFEHMKPPQAAALFATMETEFAAGFIARLDPQFAGEVMAELDPTLAYGISAVLAGRHAQTPRE
ncbi:MAG: hypothetical protein HLUCCA05_09825 [Roseibaca calidilacus]|uniref:Flagellar motility protein MotE, a chaperone for MotC folding n=1 Tax=Roseibaca calidilacus TaxID=1666912 RepID=A0A0P7WYJ5_9RHOB|nr:hypothetical protein [Roseibaca calidilacus]KPP92683.1 MAG: hypothetical protein HLUCCA05_09825 [Roseibaca calidilacus]CUX80244.1 Flagellar motility protein MotE, a chaperone for MotC folding [Roseibaca calidilacus]